MLRRQLLLSTVAPLIVAAAAPGYAGTLTGWNLANTTQNTIGSNLEGDPIGVSPVYDRDVTGGIEGATTNGRIIWIETPSPGMVVLNDDDDLNPNIDIPNCIVAVGGKCEGAFQSDKRVKNAVSANGPIDFVFDATSDDESNSYQMFHRFSNLTPEVLEGFTLELGTGVGEGFVRSGDGDGLSFDLGAELGPNDLPAFSQFPFGLFGDADSTPNFTIDGFFGPERASFDMGVEENVITSGALSKIYTDLFGHNMLNQLSVPDGYFYEFDPDRDPLLMAWLREDGMWEQRRDLITDEDGNTIVSTLLKEDWLTFGDVGDWADPFEFATVDDLRAINLNYSLFLDENFQGDQVTLRFTTTAPAPIPLPAAGWLMIAGIGALVTVSRRRREAQATG